MGAKSKIEWTDGTCNPVRARLLDGSRTGWHCEHVNEACKFCYADRDNKNRFGTRLDYKPGHRKDVEIFFDDKMIDAALKWSGRRIFICSMTDAFADFVDETMRDRMFALAAVRPDHTLQFLTKRPEAMQRYASHNTTPGRVWARAMALAKGRSNEELRAISDRIIAWPLPNVWLGTSVHDQFSHDAFVPSLLNSPARRRFISYEPALGPVDFHSSFYVGREGGWEYWGDRRQMIDLVISGGESGAEARPARRAWFLSARDQCEVAKVAYFFKQWGEWIDADEFTGNTGTPLNFGQAMAAVKKPDPRLTGVRFEHQSDGSTMLRVGRARAGRLLEGRTHDELPAAYPVILGMDLGSGRDFSIESEIVDGKLVSSRRLSRE